MKRLEQCCSKLARSHQALRCENQQLISFTVLIQEHQIVRRQLISLQSTRAEKAWDPYRCAGTGVLLPALLCCSVNPAQAPTTQPGDGQSWETSRTFSSTYPAALQQDRGQWDDFRLHEVHSHSKSLGCDNPVRPRDPARTWV